MIRIVLGSLLAVTGAAAAALSPFRAWYGGRHGDAIAVADLFTSVGVTARDAALPGSLFLPMLFAALLTALGLLARSRAAVALAGVVVLGVTVLWTVRQEQFSGTIAAGGDGLGSGVAWALGGGALLLLGARLLPGRHAVRSPGPAGLQTALPAELPAELAGQEPVPPPPPAYDPPPPYAPGPAYGSGPAYEAEPSFDAAPTYDAQPPYDDGGPHGPYGGKPPTRR